MRKALLPILAALLVSGTAGALIATGLATSWLAALPRAQPSVMQLQAMARVVKAGASVRVPVQAGPHEYRAVLEDRNGALLVISQKRAA